MSNATERLLAQSEWNKPATQVPLYALVGLDSNVFASRPLRCKRLQTLEV